MSSGKGPGATAPASPGDDPSPQVSSIRLVQAREMVHITQALKDAAAHAQDASKVPAAAGEPARDAPAAGSAKVPPAAGSDAPAQPKARPVGNNSPTPQTRPMAKRTAGQKPARTSKPARPAKRPQPTTMAQDAINAMTGQVGITASGPARHGLANARKQKPRRGGASRLPRISRAASSTPRAIASGWPSTSPRTPSSRARRRRSR